jgi:hypothetical protein
MIKTFEVDFNDFEQVSKLFMVAKCRYHELKRKKDNKKSHKERCREMLDLMSDIYNMDILSEFNDDKLSKEKKFYVYAHGFDNELLVISKSGKNNPKKVFAAQLGLHFKPVYIGKGCNGRVNDEKRNRAYSKIKKTYIGYGAKPLKFVIKDNLTELEALLLEGKLIDIFNFTFLANSGWLCNLDAGYMVEKRRSLYQDKLDQIKAIA